MKIKFWIGISAALLFILPSLNAQEKKSTALYNRQDSLRGSLNVERTGWDVLHYEITVAPQFENKFISGTNQIQFKVLHAFQQMQLDLQVPMQIDSIFYNNKKVKFEREGNAFHVSFPTPLTKGSYEKILIHFSGNPRVAKNAPWDGGWIFTKDQKGRPWMTVACQGLGASVWYPCKDHQSDEPDSGAILRMIVPDTLMAVGNGRLIDQQAAGEHKRIYSWRVYNPINNYNIIPYIGKYVNWTETFSGLKGNLNCSYYVIDYEKEKALQQFKQASLMLKSFEDWFGPYPFYEDGYKLVQSPHLGMEHQSAVAYGNGFQNGYRGRDLSSSGWGKLWDFIIVHESGHEWFANNITSNDIADMWIHESFTNYSETLFTSTYHGVEAGNDYVTGTRKLIQNDRPIIGDYGVQHQGSGDMYYKGGNMIHMIRQLLQDDEKFKQLLKSIQQKWYHKTLDSKDLEQFIIDQTGFNLKPLFDQYLRHTEIPTLEYEIQGNTIRYRFTNCIPDFALPLKITAGATYWMDATTTWKSLSVAQASLFKVDRNFYINSKVVSSSL